MKQVVTTQNGGDVQVIDVPRPLLRPSGVLVRTAYSLVSAGTERAKVELAQKSLLGKARAKPDHVRQVLNSVRDVGLAETYRKVSNRLEALQPLGYSSAGVVVAVGDEVNDLATGDVVACAGAGYANHAEYCFVPRNLCARVPAGANGGAGIPIEHAAFATVGAIALHGVRQADLRLGESVAVIGLGLVGLLAAQMFKAAGCRVIGMDLNARRCTIAESLGCSVTQTDPDQFLDAVQAFTNGAGVDAAVLTAATASSEPIALATRACRDRGRIVVVGDVGMDVCRTVFYEKELELRISRSYGPGRYDCEYEEKGRDYPIGYVRWTERRNLEAFLSLVQDGSIDVSPLITHTFDMGRVCDAYELITRNTEPYIGVLIKYPEPAANVTGTIRKAAFEVAAPRPAAAATIGLIGCGNFAQDVLLPAFRADSRFRLSAVASASGITARSVAQRFGFKRAAASPEEIINDAQINTVVIATRHDAHAALVVQALQAGKHIFVEKPLAVNEEQLHEVATCYSAVEPKPILTVGFNRRFAPSIQAIKEFFSGCSEPLSLHFRVNAGYLPPTHWLHDSSAGGGRIVGEGCHFIDLMWYLARAPLAEVFAYALPDDGRYRQDNVVANLKFDNGSVGVLHYLANGDKRVAKERLEVFGGGSIAILNDFRDLELVSGGRTKRYGGLLGRKNKGHRSEIKAFADAVCDGGPSPTPFEEIVATTSATFAIRESIRTGQVIALHAATSDKTDHHDEVRAGR